MKTLSQLCKAAVISCVFSPVVVASNIDFEIQGIKAGEGKLYIQIFQGKENYEKGDAFNAMIIQPQSDSQVIRFNNVVPGEYAIRFFHDENGSGQLDTNLFGMPTEGYGFSNNAKPNFGPASYDDMMFVVKEGDTVVTNSSEVIY